MQDYGLPWVMSKRKPGQMLGTMWRMTHLTILCISNHQMPRFCDYHTNFFAFYWFSVIRGSAIAALPWMLDLWSSCQTVFVEMVFKMNIEFCCHLQWFTDTILFNVWWSLSLSFGFWQLFLLADNVLPWFVYVVITLEATTLDTPNKVVVLVTDAPAKHIQNNCAFWKSEKSPILQYFHTNCY